MLNFTNVPVSAQLRKTKSQTRATVCSMQLGWRPDLFIPLGLSPSLCPGLPLHVSRCIGAAVLHRLLMVHNYGRMPILLLSTSRGVEYASSSRTTCAIWNVPDRRTPSFVSWWQSVRQAGLGQLPLETKVTKCAQAVEAPESFPGCLTPRLWTRSRWSAGTRRSEYDKTRRLER